MIQMALKISSRTFLLKFWCLPAFVVVFLSHMTYSDVLFIIKA